MVEMTIPSALLTHAFSAEYHSVWPTEWTALLSTMAQHLRFPWLLGRLCRALSLFTTRCGEHMVVASVVGNRWLDTVGVMVNTVLYHWDRSLSEEEWVAHVQEVQSGSEQSLEALKLSLHLDSRLPLTNVMVVWEQGFISNNFESGDSVSGMNGKCFSLTEAGCQLSGTNWTETVWSSFWNQLISTPSLDRPPSIRRSMDPEQHLLLQWLQMCEQRGDRPAMIDDQDRVTTYSEMLSRARVIVIGVPVRS